MRAGEPAGVPEARRRVVPSALGRRRPTLLPVAGRIVDDDAADRRELDVLVATLVALSALVGGPAVALIAVLVLAATALGALHLLGAIDAPNADRGVPIEALIVPAVAALGSVGVIRLVPVGPGLVVALVGVALLVGRCVALETRIVRSPQPPTADERTAILVTMLVVALLAFAGVAAVVPGGLAGLEPAGAPVAPLPLVNLVILAAADAVIAALLGYRAAALRVARLRDALWAALSYGIAIAIGAAGVRAIGLPRLIGPALLMFLFYLWDTLHAAPPSRRRDPRWIWETAGLAAVGIAVVAWNLRLEG
ncbi:MAG TPA: hypothetical protein VFP22_07030 [Candidatus Limnocylindrales bacterium]|nr:hypothetical protein [Candidatus Limnocylindrales bacterium]